MLIPAPIIAEVGYLLAGKAGAHIEEGRDLTVEDQVDIVHVSGEGLHRHLVHARAAARHTGSSALPQSGRARSVRAGFADAGVGEFDEDDFGKGESILYMYGPDADKLFDVIQPLLQRSPLTKGGYAIKRYGEAEDEDAREVRVDF